jgi:hypothetical protein
LVVDSVHVEPESLEYWMVYLVMAAPPLEEGAVHDSEVCWLVFETPVTSVGAVGADWRAVAVTMPTADVRERESWA